MRAAGLSGNDALLRAAKSLAVTRRSQRSRSKMLLVVLSATLCSTSYSDFLGCKTLVTDAFSDFGLTIRARKDSASPTARRLLHSFLLDKALCVIPDDFVFNWPSTETLAICGFCVA